MNRIGGVAALVLALALGLSGGVAAAQSAVEVDPVRGLLAAGRYAEAIDFRQQEPQVMAHPYDHQAIGGMLLYTSHEVMLDDLISRPIQSGDVLSNANTILLMGKTRIGNQIGRAMYVAKHRGSACDEAILPFRITGCGLEFG